MSVPRNVFWFEVLLYTALALDALSVAFADHRTGADLLLTSMAAALILFQFYLVRMAVQRRAGWPRWVLIAALVLAVLSLVQVAAGEGIRLYHVIEIASCVLAAFGLYLSFTGDAENWFE
jgi:hypothetical protein